jgi:hypothetical protein
MMFLWNLDGGGLAVGLQNGMICIFDVLGNGDFHLRTNGTSPVKKKFRKKIYVWDIFRVILHQ